MTTYTYTGFILQNGDTFGGQINADFVVSAGVDVSYQLSSDPNAGINDFGVPEVDFDGAGEVAAIINNERFGSDPNDEIFVFDVYTANGTLTLLTFYDASEGVDYGFLLASTDPNIQSVPTNQTELDAFRAAITGGGATPAGAPYGIGEVFDMDGAISYVSQSENDIWSGTEVGDYFDGAIGDDELYGQEGDDTLIGGAGEDYINGGLGDDSIDGGTDFDQVTYDDATGSVTVNLGTGLATGAAGNDTLSGIEAIRGSAFDDSLVGNGDRNHMRGLEGNDTLIGGGGDDLVRYDRDANYGGTAGVNVNLSTGVAIDGFGDTDSLSGFVDVRATESDDTIIGDGNDNELEGNGGDDVIVGGAGNDTLDGGAGDGDVVLYLLETGANGVNVNLGTGIATDSHGDTDTLIGIERVGGTNQADTLLGDGNDNVFVGAAGADFIDGAGGEDQVTYDQDSSGVSVDLGTGLAVDGSGSTDTLQGIENVEGSEFDDTLIGDGGDNRIIGRQGNDSLVGGGGNDYFDPLFSAAESDTIDGGAGSDTVEIFDDSTNFTITTVGGVTTVTDGSASVVLTNVEFLRFDSDDVTINLGGQAPATPTPGDDVLIGTTGDDSIDGLAGNDEIDGLDGNDTLIGGDGEDEIDGGLGNDVIDGGADFDQVYYDDATGAVTVNLGTGLATGAAGNDTITGIEMIRGSAFDDSLVGDGDRNHIRGLEGNDTLIGGGGDDLVRYDRDANYGGTAGVNVNLATGVAIDGFGDTDSLSGFVDVRATESNDTIIGDGNDNKLEGFGGSDSIEGGDGNDELIGGNGNDTLRGGDGDDTIADARGNDVLDGGDGIDTYFRDLDLDFAPFSFVWVMDLVQGKFYEDGVPNDFDELISIENVDLRGQFNIRMLGDEENNRLSSGEGDDTIDGGAGDDELIDGAGDDSVFGGVGDDVIHNTTGNDTYDGGDGFDTMLVDVSGVAQGTFVYELNFVTGYSGQLGNPTLSDTVTAIEALDFTGEIDVQATGDDNANLFQTGDGNDTIHGGGGNDTIRDGLGDDSLSGGDGDDRFELSSGAETIDGGAGFDVIAVDVTNFPLPVGFIAELDLTTGYWGQQGNANNSESLSNIEGLEFIGNYAVDATGDGNANLIDTDSGNDTLVGGGGDDTLRSGDGADSLVGGDGRDNINAGNGNDTIDSSTGASGTQGFGDIITAGLGTNTVIGHAQAFADRFGGGLDMIFEDLGGASAGIHLQVSGAQGTGTATGTGTLAGQVTTSFTYADHFEGSKGADLMEGSDFGSGVDGDYESWVGEAGNDTIDGNGGFDVVSYYLEFDGTLGVNVNLANGTATDRFGNTDTLLDIEGAQGTEMADTLIGDSLDNFLGGRGGDDSIEGGAGNDYIDAGLGGTDTIDGGIGNDTVVVDGLSADFTITSVSGTTTVTDGSTTLILTDVEEIRFNDTTASIGNATITGDAGPDSLPGTENDDVILGLGGNDTLEGLDGNDTLDGGDGDDSLDGGDGADSIIGGVGSGTDTLLGGSGSDTLEATGGNGNLLRGGAGDDVLIGGWGSDILQGNDGADSFSGGTGADDLYIDGQDTFFDGGGGYDRLIAVDPGGVNVALSGTNIERVIGGTGDDVFDGTGVALGLVISGEGGNDTLTGGSATDQVSGGAGDDVLIGGGGDDFLFGDGGSDSFEGGAGDDRFFAESIDQSFDGGAGYDRLFLLDNGDFTFALAGTGIERVNSGDGNDVLDATGVTDAVVLSGAGGNDALTGGSNNDVLAGGDGQDTLEGGSGFDSFFGGAGADSFVFEDGSGVDFLVGWEDGLDLLDFSGHAQVNGLSDLTITDNGVNSRIEFADGDALIVIGYTGGFDASDFDFV
ncbi:calcium-binding protein [Roseicyclus elongatus]|nr:calcium-binding protein [Roseibacterium elongatum]